MLDQIRRYVIGGALLAGVLTAAGCSPGSSPAAAQPAATASPALSPSPSPDVAGALARLGTESARFTLVFDAKDAKERAAGIIDSASGSWEMTGNGYVVRRIGADVYVKLTAEPVHSVYPGQYASDLGKWVHVAAPADGVAFDRDFPWAPARTASATQLDTAGRVSRVTSPDLVVSYSDYGTAVRVVAPPADQTIEDHLFTLANLGAIF
ncbi:hypothetical protein [Actinoplanes sp. L3-i22]|uniref:hypothetical protein n=1 Tax=Actinoplanes sp. L3-i22 TaxID=2836373 RepID=UPI001C7560E2|nr:hypothetical protein [Actinoplanes sp. L3-i22]BCY10144.1 hypothetical protein L3i22_052320 [Actinoplanes sp. L3-i22]